MTYKQIRGVVPILLTPFDQQGRIDTENLRGIVEFNIDAGVDGLGIALGSEIMQLREEERDLILKTVVDQTNGRIPIVMNTSAPGTDLAVFYSQRAQDCGADAVMVMPPAPNVATADIGSVRRFFRDIDGSINISIVIQDVGPAQVAPNVVVEISEECSAVVACKMETPPTPSRIAATVEGARGTIDVLGGGGGNFLIEEMKRGSDGTMPFCSTPAEFVKICTLFRAGKVDEATRVFNECILPIGRLVSQNPGLAHRIHKEILKKRGLIDSTLVREPTLSPDDFAEHEIDTLIEQIV